MTNISIEELDSSGDLRQAADDAGARDPQRHALGTSQAAAMAASRSSASPRCSPHSTRCPRSRWRPRPRRSRAPSRARVAVDPPWEPAERERREIGKARHARVPRGRFLRGGRRPRTSPTADIAAAARTLARPRAGAPGRAQAGARNRPRSSRRPLTPPRSGSSSRDQSTFRSKTAAAIEPVGTAAYAARARTSTTSRSSRRRSRSTRRTANHAAYDLPALAQVQGHRRLREPDPQRVQPGQLVRQDGEDRLRAQRRPGRSPAVAPDRAYPDITRGIARPAPSAIRRVRARAGGAAFWHDALMASVVSVNVGRPRPVALMRGGEMRHSAIGKRPVEGRARVEGVNVAGDDQADRSVHGGPDKAVYAYASEDTAWWSAHLDRPLGPACSARTSRSRASTSRMR